MSRILDAIASIGHKHDYACAEDDVIGAEFIEDPDVGKWFTLASTVDGRDKYIFKIEIGRECTSEGCSAENKTGVIVEGGKTREEAMVGAVEQITGEEGTEDE